MMALIKTHQALPVPALSPCFNAVQMNMEFVRGLLQSQPLAQSNDRLGTYPDTWMLMKNTHVAQCLLFSRL